MTYERLPWTDYFCEPSIDQLKDKLPEEACRLFNLIRPMLIGMEEVSEKLKWFGDGWHWTISYFSCNREDSLVVLIPNPTDLQLAMQVDREFINRLTSDQIKKNLREGLELALEPFDTQWAVWSIESEGMIDDLMEFVELKRQHLSKAAG